jgi:WD40 repeat protein
MRRCLEAVVCSALVMTLSASAAVPGTPLFACTIGPEILFLEGYAGQIATLAFSPNGRLLASRGSDQMIRVQRLDTGQEPKILRGPSRANLRHCIPPGGGIGGISCPFIQGQGTHSVDHQES